MLSRFLRSLCLGFLFIILWTGLAVAQSPRLSVSQVGLHFICTADGQPDMYSWRIPVLDSSPTSDQGSFRIPAIAPEALEALSQGPSAVVSGGRTALRVREENLIGFNISHNYPKGFDGGGARLTNADAVHWRNGNTQPDGWTPAAHMIKERYYSNYPPLRNAEQSGFYFTSAIAAPETSPNYARYYRLHPGYDWRNWNWTLDFNTPLQVNQKRLQAMLHLELHHPPTTDAEKPFEFTFVISGTDLASIKVNNQALFSSARDRVFKTRKSLFQTTGVTEVGGFADARKLSLGRRSGNASLMPEDSGYDAFSQSLTMGLNNLELESDFFTMTRDEPLQFESGPITIRIYDTYNWTEAQPLQTVQVRLPLGLAPQPDLVTVGTYSVSFFQPSGTWYDHPAVQAPRWWAFNRDGVLGRFDTAGSSNWQLELSTGRSVRGRLYNWDGVNLTGGFSAVSAVDRFHTQRQPGARAFVYGADPVLYPDLKLRTVQELEENPLLRIQYEGPTYDHPLHFGSDTLRTMAATNALEPRTQIQETDFLPHPDYSNTAVRLATGRGFDTPSFATDPQSQTIPVGAPATLTAKVRSTRAVTYQWRFEGHPIPGATASSYLIPEMSKSFQGEYDVVIAVENSGATSQKAVLTVIDPFITAQPQPQTKRPGDSVSFAVAARGTGLKYQWRQNGRAIAKATGPTLLLPALKDFHQGAYDVVISGDLGTAISQTAFLTILAPLRIVQQPVGGYLPTEGELQLSVLAVGTPPFTYVWRKNGSPIAGATGPQLVLSGQTVTEPVANYDVVVSNAGEKTVSTAVAVSLIGGPPIISGQPASVAVAMGQEARFSVVVEQEVDLQFQWRRNKVHLPKAVSPELVIANAQKANEGAYDCVVTGRYGRSISEAASLTVGESLTFESVPANQFVNAGESAVFVAEVSGSDMGVSYQWSFNGKPIAGAIYSTLTVPEAAAANSGAYTVTATRAKMKATATAWLGIREPGVLIYKLTGTGQSLGGSNPPRTALTGYLLIERNAQPTPVGVIVLIMQNGSYKSFTVQSLAALRVDSTQAAAQSQTVFSSVQEGDSPVSYRSVRWFQGANSLIKLSPGAEQTLAPRTLGGQCDHVEVPGGPDSNLSVIERIAFRGVLDLPMTSTSFQNDDALGSALERLTLQLQSQGVLNLGGDGQEE
jgi:hypothetical protein